MKTKTFFATIIPMFITLVLVNIFIGKKDTVYVEVPGDETEEYRNTEPDYNDFSRDNIPSTLLYYQAKSGGARFSLNIDTNGYPLKNFQLRYFKDGEYMTGEPFRLELNKPIWDGYKIFYHVPVNDPPPQSIIVLKIDTVQFGTEIGYRYINEVVHNPEYDEYMIEYNQKMADLRQFYADNFTVFEERKFVLPQYLPLSDDYNYWWYDPTQEPWNRMVPIEDYTILEKYTGYQWKIANPSRVEQYDVIHWMAYFSVPRRNYVAWWLANRWIAR